MADVVEPDTWQLLPKATDRPAIAVAERIAWSRSATGLRVRAREIRPDHLQPEGCGRTADEPGELAKMDLCGPRTSRSAMSKLRGARCWLPCLATRRG